MKKKILFILNSLAVGGAEKQTVSLINALDKEKFELSLFYLEDVAPLLPQIDSHQASLLECLYRNKRLDLNAVKRIIQLIKQNQYDIIVCVDQYPLIYVFIASLFYPAKFEVIETLHYTIPSPNVWTQIQNNFLYRHLMNQCKKIVFVCKTQMNYWIDNFSIKKDISTFIYNSVDTNYFFDSFKAEEKMNLRASLGFSSNDFIVGICAALRPEKKHTDFVDAIQVAYRQVPNLKGLIIGEGVLRKEIFAYIETHNLSSVIKITGFQDDIRRYVSICDCMVLTSHAVETFSISALESMAMAKPVIMTDLGGAREMIVHGVSGFIYEKGDINQFASYLSALKINKNHIEMGINARQRVCRYFAMDRMINEYTHLFSSIK